MAHDLSLVALILSADPVVKAVLALLLLASIGCWTVILDKAIKLARARRAAAAFEATARTDRVPARNQRPAGLAGAIIAAGDAEWRDGADPNETRAERRERVERAMRATASGELARLEHGLPLLATIGSSAPFVGLFGTVWGIMNSFQSIALSKDTSLAVVAPGIAEALFATAIGLVAAIPSVIAYNKLATDLGRVGRRLDVAITELGGRMARHVPVAVEGGE
jgi:TolQ protein